MLGGADNANGELPSYITGANIPAGIHPARRPQDGRNLKYSLCSELKKTQISHAKSSPEKR